MTMTYNGLEITEIIVRPTAGGKVAAYCGITLNGAIAIRNIRLIDAGAGAFLAMPSQRSKVSCPSCAGSTPIGLPFCGHCGAPVPEGPPECPLHHDACFPVNHEARRFIHDAVMEEYRRLVPPALPLASTRPAVTPLASRMGRAS